MGVSGIEKGRQYLTFKLEDEVFGVDVGKVREILELSTVTKVPRTPEFMRGVINLRGNVVPVVDMRLKFGLTATEKTVNTCIVVIEVLLDGETSVLGALVDSVQEVFEMDPDQIEAAPRIGTMVRDSFILGMGKRDGGFIMLLDVDKVFSCDELSLVREAGEVAAQPAAG